MSGTGNSSGGTDRQRQWSARQLSEIVRAEVLAALSECRRTCPQREGCAVMARPPVMTMPAASLPPKPTPITARTRIPADLAAVMLEWCEREGMSEIDAAERWDVPLAEVRRAFLAVQAASAANRARYRASG